MSHDLVIRGGAVIDGTGAPARSADVAVTDGRIADVGRVTERGREEIEATGLVVAPGFIDPHTHYDAQLTWDPLASCSSWHGITTIVTGNCGFTLAPSRPQDRLTLMRMLEYVEGMSLEAMEKGIRWEFESFAGRPFTAPSTPASWDGPSARWPSPPARSSSTPSSISRWPMISRPASRWPS
jgi:N-acyl-D-amino-acid deacylase